MQRSHASLSESMIIQVHNSAKAHSLPKDALELLLRSLSRLALNGTNSASPSSTLLKSSRLLETVSTRNGVACPGGLHTRTSTSMMPPGCTNLPALLEILTIICNKVRVSQLHFISMRDSTTGNRAAMGILLWCT